MNKELVAYLHEHIIPIHQTFDQAHREDHVYKVIEHSLDIAKDFEVDNEMVYTIACYHDIGIQFGRSDHHLTGGLFLYDDLNLKSFFSEEKRMIMKEAIEDHRASASNPPRTIYGKIIAEADRDISVDTVFLRTVQFGLKHYPNLSKEEHIERAISHIEEKYGPHGYLKLWLKTKKNEEGLQQIHTLLEDSKRIKCMFEFLYDQEKNK
jgi:uncharacterized protein